MKSITIPICGYRLLLIIRSEFETAIKALEKQIPKKPNRTDWKDLPASQVLWKRDRISCPNCNWELLSTWDGGLRYCYHCGQALDWSNN